MSFKVELTVDNHVYAVKDFYLSVLRETNPKGLPCSNPSWILDVTIDVVNDTTITQWMIDPDKQLDGSLAIYKDLDTKMKNIEFRNSNCFAMIDQFIPEMSETSCYIRIAGAEIKVGGAKLPLDE
jgi:hypothetical protein